MPIWHGYCITLEIVDLTLKFLEQSKRAEQAGLEYLLEIGALVVQVSGLVHALQRERGISNLMLVTRSGHALQQRAQLCADTDASFAQLESILKNLPGLDEPGKDSARLYTVLAEALSGMECLPSVRSAVEAFTAEPEFVVTKFNASISQWLQVVFEAADTALYPAMAACLVALFNLMEGKEFAGQERAHGAYCLGRGRVTRVDGEKWTDLALRQEHAFQLFLKFAPKAVNVTWQQFIRQSCWQTIADMRRSAIESKEFGQLPDPAVWFQQTTVRIDGLRNLELALLLELEGSARQRMQVLLDNNSTGGFKGLSKPSIGTEFPVNYQHTLFNLVREQSVHIDTVSSQLTQARAALEERKWVDQAKAILIRTHQLAEPEAHRILQKAAMKERRSLVEIARHVLQSHHQLSQSAVD